MTNAAGIVLASRVEQARCGFVVLEPFAQDVRVNSALSHGSASRRGPGLELIKGLVDCATGLDSSTRSHWRPAIAEARAMMLKLVRVRFRVPVAVEIRFRFVTVRADTVTPSFAPDRTTSLPRSSFRESRPLQIDYKGQEC